MAVVAVGSHGRGDRAPWSDLDLVLVHRGRRDIKQVADRIWYPIWDRGVRLDHSVRTVKEALAVADSDLKAALGLIDGRPLAGDRALADDLLVRVRGQWRKRAARWLPQLAAAVNERHDRFGEVAFLLEPEIKEGRGGLRDVVVLRAAALATPVIGDRIAAAEPPYRTLLAVRAALHRRSGSPLDRLLLQEQDGVAALMGHRDADALMAEVAAAARAISYVCDDCWQRVSSSLAGPRGRLAARDHVVGPGLVLRDGELVHTSAAAPDAVAVVDAAATAADLGVPLARPTLARFELESRPPPEPWPAALRNALVALLGAGPAAIPVLEALDHHGLLVRLLPEWAAVRHKPQRNAYHRFTVDRHLCEAAAQAAALTRQVARPDLLLVGAWLHDIGKGFPGDHTEVGVVVVGQIAARMGFAPADVATLVALVRHHLLLADAATRRDLDDPATVERVAEAVGDRGTLELLAALTEADSLATGPSAWSDWKAGLVADLVARTAARLTGPSPPEPAPLPVPDVPRRGLHLEGDDRSCTVVADDRPGLFSQVAGVLALHGLEVLSAQAGSAGEGRAVEVLEVEPAFGGAPDWPRVAADLEAAVTGRLPLDARLAERAHHYASHYRTTAARPARPRVLVDNDASAKATVLEVRAPDGVGVLHRITAALAERGLDVRFARVSTLGHEVVDAFYVVGPDGAKVTDPEELAEVERAVLRRLAG